MEEYYDADAVLDRVLLVAKLKRDTQLASLLGVSPQAVSQARKKRRVPENWLIRMAASHHVSIAWLLYGKDDEEQTARVALRRPQSHGSGDGAELAFVPLVAASLSAGSGSLESGGEVLDYFAFRQNWLLRKGNPDQMVLMKVYGDSMEPDICHGDMVLVDQGNKHLFGHAIYAVGVNEEIYVKQIETLPGHRMLLRSLNERYAPIEVDLRGDLADSVRIIGRVLWWCREA